jgi:N-acetylneuraminic acid mutarotase
MHRVFFRKSLALIAVAAALLLAHVSAPADTTAWQTNPWESQQSIPPDPAGGANTGRTEATCSAMIGGKIYTALGFNGGPGGSQQDTSALRIFDPTTGLWTVGPSAPIAKAEGYRGVAHGGSLYCVAGRSGSTQAGFKPESTTQSFNPATLTWSTLAPMPAACNGSGCVGTTAVTYASNIFVFGGRDSANGPCTGTASQEIYRYDIPSNTWVAAGSLPSPVSDTTAARVGRYVYIFGGCDAKGSDDPRSATYYNTVWKYDPRTQTVATLSATMPTPRADAGAGNPQNGSSANASHLIHVTGGLCLNQSGGCPPPDATGEVVKPNHIAFDVDQQQFTATPGTEMPRHCTENGYAYLPSATAPRYSSGLTILENDRAEHELVYGGDRIYSIGGACPGQGRSLGNVDMQKLSGPNDPPAANASMTAYSCNANTFPVCATEPLGASVVLVTASGFTPLSTVTLTSSSVGVVLPVAVTDVQGELVTTYVDTSCTGSATTITGTDSAGNHASVTFTCPEA